jgi:hypothetical protein
LMSHAAELIHGIWCAHMWPALPVVGGGAETWRERNGYATATHHVAVMRHNQLMVNGGRSVVDH